MLRRRMLELSCLPKLVADPSFSLLSLHRELPGDNFYLNTCMECPKNYPWIKDYTGNGFAL